MDRRRGGRLIRPSRRGWATWGHRRNHAPTRARRLVRLLPPPPPLLSIPSPQTTSSVIFKRTLRSVRSSAAKTRRPTCGPNWRSVDSSRTGPAPHALSHTWSSKDVCLHSRCLTFLLHCAMRSVHQLLAPWLTVCPVPSPLSHLIFTSFAPRFVSLPSMSLPSFPPGPWR